MACGCCDLNRIKKLFEEKRKKEAEAVKAIEEEKEVLKEAEVKPITKLRKKKVEVQEEKISEEEESLW